MHPCSSKHLSAFCLVWHLGRDRVRRKVSRPASMAACVMNWPMKPVAPTIKILPFSSAMPLTWGGTVIFSNIFGGIEEEDKYIYINKSMLFGKKKLYILSAIKLDFGIYIHLEWERERLGSCVCDKLNKEQKRGFSTFPSTILALIKEFLQVSSFKYKNIVQKSLLLSFIYRFSLNDSWELATVKKDYTIKVYHLLGFQQNYLYKVHNIQKKKQNQQQLHKGMN